MAAKLPFLTVEGPISEIRELRGGPDKKVFAWILKILCPGITVELQHRGDVPPKGLGEGMEIKATAKLTTFNGVVRFELWQWVEVAAAEAAAAAAVAANGNGAKPQPAAVSR